MIRPFNPEVWDEGAREVERLLALIDGPDPVDGTEFGDGTTVYEHSKLIVERFATALFGPTARVSFMFDEDGDIVDSFLAFASGGDEVIIPIPEFRQEELLAALRADNAELERHG